MISGSWHLVLLASALGAAILLGGTWADASAMQPPTMPASTAPALSNAMCPVMPNEPVDAGIFSDYQGRRVYFCCSKCRAKFQRSPQSYAANLSSVVAEEGLMGNPVAGEFGDPVPEPKDGNDAHGHAHDGEAGHEPGTTQPATTVPSGEMSAADAASHGPPRSHDHATAHIHPEDLSGGERLARFAGKFHPVVVHLPISALLMALLAEGLFMFSGRAWQSGAARFCVLLGASGALIAAMLGWLDAAFAGYEGEMLATLNTHRWLGVGTAVWAILLLISSEVSQRHPGRAGWRRSYRMALLIGATLVGVAGHFGATLIYGLDYFRW